MKKQYRILMVLLLAAVNIGFDCPIVQGQGQSTQQAPDTTIVIGPVTIDTTAEQADDTVAAAEEEQLDQFSDFEELFSYGTILLIITLLMITYFVNRFVVMVLGVLSERFTKYRLGIKRMVPVIRLFIWSFVFYIIIAGIIDPPFGTVITVLASIGIAVGFAAQDILKNIFGGFMIILDRPFQVGDKIGVGDHYGEVVAIGLRSSRIVTPDDSIVSIPNSEIMNEAVSNANSSALDCQVVAEIYLPMDVDVDTVKRIAYRAAASSRYVYLQKPISVNGVNEVHEDNYVFKLRVKAYVLDIRYEFPFKSDMTELILSELKDRDLLPKKAVQ
jgi:small-conductance mechanosensitive channel